MFKLHYANLDLGNDDIPCFEFKKHSQMIDFIDEKCFNRNGQVVWLLAKKGSTDVFISESHLSIQDYFSKKYLWNISGDYFLQEYSVHNGCGYDQWRITSTKLSKYDTE